MYRGDTSEMKELDFVYDPTCVAFDWLGKRLYWSVYRNGQVSLQLTCLVTSELNFSIFHFWSEADVLFSKDQQLSPLGQHFTVFPVFG